MTTHIVGIDWAATDEAKCGLALAELEGGRPRIITLMHGKACAEERSAAELARWLARFPDALVAMDAPLGWPRELARAVAGHVAGEPLGGRSEAGRFFTRETDRFVRARFQKTPLEVGADRIARTAFSALALLAELRSTTKLALPMAWMHGPGVIEVYPAATLKVLAAPAKVPPYKKPEQRDARRALLAIVTEHVELTRPQRALAEASDHALDAIVCILAGADFLAGRALGPPGALLDVARHEGWIWVRSLTAAFGGP